MLSLLGAAMGTDLACSLRKCVCRSGTLHLIPGARCDGALSCLLSVCWRATRDGASGSGNELGSARFSCIESHNSAFGGRSCSIHWAFHRLSWGGFTPQALIQRGSWESSASCFLGCQCQIAVLSSRSL